MYESTMASETFTRRRNEGHINVDYDHRGHNENNLRLNNNNNNNNMLKFGHPVPVLMPQNSLPIIDGHSLPASQSLLVPPSFSSRERRHSTSSCDSSVSIRSRRSLSRNPSSRMSDFEEDKKDITLLTFARAAKTACKKIGAGVRKAINLLFVTRSRGPNIVCEAEVMEQAGWIVTDYIISRLASRQLMSRKVGLTPSDWYKSVHVINAGFALELTYPKVYSNVSRKLSMTMSSPKIVRTTLTALLKVLFEENITWGKVVSMFAVAGLFAEECASQGHADYVKVVVDVVVDFTSTSLLPWLVAHGGWDAFPVPGNNERSRLSKLRLMILTGATTAIAVTTWVFLDFW